MLSPSLSLSPLHTCIHTLSPVCSRLVSVNRSNPRSKTGHWQNVTRHILFLLCRDEFWFDAHPRRRRHRVVVPFPNAAPLHLHIKCVLIFVFVFHMRKVGKSRVIGVFLNVPTTLVCVCVCIDALEWCVHQEESSGSSRRRYHLRTESMWWSRCFPSIWHVFTLNHTSMSPFVNCNSLLQTNLIVQQLLILLL